jgi:hypothetical protein
MKAPLGGGTATTLASKQNLPHGIVVQENSLYWANQGLETGSASSGTVMLMRPQAAMPALSRQVKAP